MSWNGDRQNEIQTIVIRQLRNYWIDIDESIILSVIPDALDFIDRGFQQLPSKRFYDGGTIFSSYFSVHWMIFLYRLAHEIFIKWGEVKEADQVYYLNKIMHSIDWFYAIDLPIHFLCEHPLGSVLGRAKYGDFFFIYQGTTVGGNRSHGKLCYPTIGNNVILYANATVLGDCHIGNNVVISSGSYLINEIIPDNCIVFGSSPNVVVKVKTEEEIRKYTQHIWGGGK